MRSLTIALLCLLFACLTVSGVAQKHSEFGLSGGAFYYVGELNPDKHFLTGVKPGGGLVYRRVLNKRYALKFNALYGKLQASDLNYSQEFHQFRAYGFNATLIEGSGHIEFNFLPYLTGDKDYYFSPYVFCGITVFYANPESYFTGNNDSFYNDGGGSNSLVTPAFPFGMGVKYSLLNRLGLSVEWGMRKTFTDQLDAINNRYNNSVIQGFQKGKKENNDWYSYIGIMLTYRLNTKADKCPAYNF